MQIYLGTKPLELCNNQLTNQPISCKLIFDGHFSVQHRVVMALKHAMSRATKCSKELWILHHCPTVTIYCTKTTATTTPNRTGLTNVC